MRVLLQSSTRHVAGPAGSGSEVGEARRRHGAMGVLRAGVAVSAALVCVFATNEVRAHKDLNLYNSAHNAAHAGSGCPASSRVAHAASTCVDATWNNSPDASEGVSSQYSVQWENSCHNYGDIVVDVNLSPGEDEHVHLNTSVGGTMRSQSRSSDVSGISCCWDESDLCHIREVVAEDGQIIKHTSGTSYTLVDVSTHRNRYDLCQSQAGADLIYCDVNPEGDAFTEPTPAVPDRLPISLQDCHDGFAESSAAASCGDFHADAQDGRDAGTESEREMLPLDDSMCHGISARCPAGGSRFSLVPDRAIPVDDVADLKFCEWGVTTYMWNLDLQSFVRDNTEEHQQLRTDVCPESSEEYQDADGNPTDPGLLEDATGANRTSTSGDN